MLKRTHLWYLTALLVVLSIVVAACTPAATAPTEEAPSIAAGGGTLIGGFDVGPGGDPQTVPYHAGAGNTWRSKIWTPLVMMNEDFSELTSEGALAVSWEVNEDATVWTFDLREGVLWHDGEPFTAQDIKFTLELVAHPESEVTSFGVTPGTVVGWDEYRAGEADEITGVKVLDDLTIQFELMKPNPRFTDDVRALYALPKHALSDLAPSDYLTTDWWWTDPIGTGPFMFSSYEKDQFMELVPNPYYWDGEPKLEKLINRYFVDEIAAVLALESGDIQFTYVSADVAARLRDNPNYQVFSGPSYVTNFLIYNARNDTWQDERVRKAFMYGIDREAIVNQVYDGTAEITPCLDPYPAFWPEDAEPYAYDPDKARELLAEAGFDTSVEYEIPTYYSSQLAKDVLQVIQSNLADIGVKVTPRFMDPAAWRAIVEGDLQYDIAYRGHGTGPASFPDLWYRSDGFPGLGGSYYGINDPQLEGLIDAMDATMTPEDYKAARTAVCSYMNETALQGYMWVSTRYGIASTSVKDFHYFPAPGGGPFLDHAEKWYIAED